MVKYSEPALDRVFAALSDSTRRGILADLVNGETSVTALAAPHKMSLPGVSKHLRVLERAGLVHCRKEGRVHHCRLAAQPMRNALEWLAQYRWFWENNFHALARHLNES